ncbi:hypothetical protein F2Q69_00045960 [Brassica cretica]|uniref:Uncharacterized protein n=1 Tax=Brassica cretica TaxID=69181 RepID=A0A8S9Q7W6_BRACR|nr:hypothetical protein F2Q69_00045960 [Brassica cretica]
MHHLLKSDMSASFSIRLGEKRGTPSKSSWNSFRVLLELLQSPLGTPSESSWNSFRVLLELLQSTYISVPGTTMKKRFLGSSKKEPANSHTSHNLRGKYRSTPSKQQRSIV